MEASKRYLTICDVDITPRNEREESFVLNRGKCRVKLAGLSFPMVGLVDPTHGPGPTQMLNGPHLEEGCTAKTLMYGGNLNEGRSGRKLAKI